MSEITLEEYQRLVEEQGLALLDVVQSVALGNLDTQVEVPEGVEVLSELAVGIEMMIDDLRAMWTAQEKARAEIEESRRQLAQALDEVLAVQRRYLAQQWQEYAAEEKAGFGYFRDQQQEGPTGDAWLPAMTQAVQRVTTVAEKDPAGGATLAVPVSLYGEVIGALGFRREGGGAWSADEIAIVEAVVEQIGWALESQRLFDEEQRARALLSARVNELDCLNDIGRKIDEVPPIPEFLQWVTGRIPSAMQYPDLCVAAIEFEGQLYGTAAALDLPCQMVQHLHVGGRPAGRIAIAYTAEREFIDEESALLGDIARRVSGYIENRRLFQETQQAALRLEEERTLLRTMIDNLPDYVYVKDRQSRFLINNIAHLGVMGAKSQEEVLGKTDFDFFPEHLAARYFADEQELMRTGQILVGREEPVVDQTTGKELWVTSTKVPLRDARGEVYGFVGLTRDITERKAAERALERRRLQLECLSDIGQKIGEAPSVPDFLQWVAGRLPAAMQYPDVCRVAIAFAGQVYGAAEAQDLPCQMVQTLQVGGERAGRLTVAYTEPHDFLNEESALLGDVSRRVSGYLENVRLLEQTQAALNETAMLYRVVQSLVQITDEREMFEFTLSEYLGILNLSQGGVLTFDEEGREATLRALMLDGQPAEPGRRIPIADNPAYAKLLATKEPVVITDALHDPLLGSVRGLSEEVSCQSLLLVPLMMGRQLVGALEADSTDTIYHFSDRDIALLRTVADQLGIALENRRLFRETQAALAEVEATHRSYLRRAWQDHLRQQEIMRKSAFVYDQTQAGSGEAWAAFPDLWRPEMEVAVRQGRYVADQTAPAGEQASLAIPITLRGQTIGVLGVEAPAGERQWTEDDLALIQAIGDQLAQTLETARLFADTRRRAERERLISEITTRIRASTDMRDIIETAAVELGQALGTSRALVRLSLGGLEPHRRPEPAPASDAPTVHDQ